jgi:hypothetical protein
VRVKQRPLVGRNVHDFPPQRDQRSEHTRRRICLPQSNRCITLRRPIRTWGTSAQDDALHVVASLSIFRDGDGCHKRAVQARSYPRDRHRISSQTGPFRSPSADAPYTAARDQRHAEFWMRVAETLKRLREAKETAKAQRSRAVRLRQRARQLAQQLGTRDWPSPA